MYLISYRFHPDIEPLLHDQHLLSVQARLQGSAIIKELASAIVKSSVPVMINVGLDIFESSSQMTFQLVALQFSRALDCCQQSIKGNISIQIFCFWDGLKGFRIQSDPCWS